MSAPVEPNPFMPHDWMRQFVLTPDMRFEIGMKLIETFDGTDYPRPMVDDVIEHAVRVVIADTRERAEDLADCNKIDHCTAEAIALRNLADWMEAAFTKRAVR